VCPARSFKEAPRASAIFMTVDSLMSAFRRERGLADALELFRSVAVPEAARFVEGEAGRARRDVVDERVGEIGRGHFLGRREVTSSSRKPPQRFTAGSNATPFGWS
jgi:hypothetical protein